MKNKIVVLIFIGLLLWFSGLNPSLNAQTTEKKKRIPKGLKTKTEINYKFVKKLANTSRSWTQSIFTGMIARAMRLSGIGVVPMIS